MANLARASGVGHHSHVLRTGHPVLDIGDDTGGVIFLTPSALCWQEIEIAPMGTPDRTHTEVTERLVSGEVIYTGVFPPLASGEYYVCRPAYKAGELFSVRAGQVTQIDWRGVGAATH